MIPVNEEKPRKEGEISIELNSLTSSIECLEQLVPQLRGRFENVLDNTKDKEEQKYDAACLSSKMGDRIQSLHFRLETICTGLSRLLDDCRL